MKVVDANVLLYAGNADSRQHGIARRWLSDALSATETVGFPWVTLLAFLRISTNPRIFDRPLGASQAFDLVDAWLAPPPATLVAPTHRHASVLRGLLEQAGTAGNLTTDAHLAAIAVEHGATVVSFDRDFARFAVKVELLQ